MKVVFVSELQNKIRSDCDLCRRKTLLEYLIMDEDNRMYAVCNECKEDLLKQKTDLED